MTSPSKDGGYSDTITILHFRLGWAGTGMCFLDLRLVEELVSFLGHN